MITRRLECLPEWLLLIVVLLPIFETGLNATSPLVLVPGITIQQVVKDPELVTPVSCAADSQGNLYVIESHTHFRPDAYTGSVNDRIWIFPGQKVAKPESLALPATPHVILESTRHTMQLAVGPEDSLLLATRNEVRLIGSAAQGVFKPSAEPGGESILKLQTKADYPHNGLSGLTSGTDGMLYVGLGENFGEPYELSGKHEARVSGEGEGGSIFRCQLDGSGLERVATGFWNPFAMTFDSAGRLWVVDNDPDASPPCRLIHVIPGADYGFQFRFDRAGTNPLLAWNGELPGTLGFNCGTGEAPSGIVFHRGYLWVTSWGDNCVERYRLASNAGRITATREIVIQGDTRFRPVGIAIGANEDLFITDWVDRSYTLHGQGSLWKVSFTDETTRVDPLPQTSTEQQACRLTQGDPLLGAPPADDNMATLLECLQGLQADNPTIRTAAGWGLRRFVQGRFSCASFQELQLPLARISYLQAVRWHDLDRPSPLDPQLRQQLCKAALTDEDSAVRIAAVRWIAEANLTEMRDEVAKRLDQTAITLPEFRVVLAALDYLDLPKTDHAGARSAGKHTAARLVGDQTKSSSLRAFALRMLPANETGMSLDDLSALAKQGGDLGREATRTIALHTAPSRFPYLIALAQDKTLDEQLRADAVMGLAALSPLPKLDLTLLLRDEAEAVRQEAARVLRHSQQATEPASNNSSDREKWQRIIETPGDPDAGWRVFFRASGGKCAACHSYERRGADVGPELATLAGTQTTHRILDSLLEPSREIAPLYVPWRIVATDGRVLTGIKLHVPGTDEKTRYLARDGSIFELALAEIEEQSPLTQSIMPSGLCNLMNEDEVRDLVTLLSTSRSDRD